MEQDRDPVEQDIVSLVISTINDMAEEAGSPTFQQLIEIRIKDYAEFTKSLIFAESSAQVAAVVREHDDAKILNDKIQQYVKLSERGLVTINPSDIIRSFIWNPIVQTVSDEESATLLIEWETETIPDEFFDVVDRVVVGAAAAQLLGGIQFWIEPNVLSPTNYALVHSISSTRH